jgi:hypothetical protein
MQSLQKFINCKCINQSRNSITNSLMLAESSKVYQLQMYQSVKKLYNQFSYAEVSESRHK